MKADFKVNYFFPLGYDCIQQRCANKTLIDKISVTMNVKRHISITK